MEKVAVTPNPAAAHQDKVSAPPVAEEYDVDPDADADGDADRDADADGDGDGDGDEKSAPWDGEETRVPGPLSSATRLVRFHSNVVSTLSCSNVVHSFRHHAGVEAIHTS